MILMIKSSSKKEKYKNKKSLSIKQILRNGLSSGELGQMDEETDGMQ